MRRPRGVKELEKWQLEDKKLSLKQAILAKCADCMCNYLDGKADCELKDCPLYSYMVYGALWKGREKKISPRNALFSAYGKQKQGNLR